MTEENKVDDVLISEQEEITIGDKDVLITELPRKKYKKLMKVLGKVVKDIDSGNLDINLKNIENEVEALLLYLADDVLLEIYEIATGLEQDFLEENLTMSKEIKLFADIFKVNRVEEIIKNLQSLVGVMKPVMGIMKSLRG